jgi:hypothetical protein
MWSFPYLERIQERPSTDVVQRDPWDPWDRLRPQPQVVPAGIPVVDDAAPVVLGVGALGDQAVLDPLLARRERLA